jgi:hypothetical protein
VLGSDGTVVGAQANLTVHRPTLAPNDAHTLAEIAVSSADHRQIAEVGWTVDRLVNGDADVHLFVYYWVNAEPTCYNSCGFVVDPAAAYRPGDRLPVSDTPQKFAIVHRSAPSAGWWVMAMGAWIGHFPDTLWSKAGVSYTEAGLVQWFGEVNTSDPDGPCSDMGNGLPGSAPGAAAFTDIGLTVASGAERRGDISLGYITDSQLYSAGGQTSTSVRYGGQGDTRPRCG